MERPAKDCDSVIVSSSQASACYNSAEEKRLHRRRYVTLCLLIVALVALLVPGPKTLKALLASRNVPASEQGSAVTHAPSRAREVPAAEARKDAAASKPLPTTDAIVRPVGMQTQRAPVLAIIADYDNCWDIISQTNPSFHQATWYSDIQYFSAMRLIRAVSNIVAGRQRVILFVGSKRQSLELDSYYAKLNGNGLALGPEGAFELWAAKNKDKGWELNRALLADGNESLTAWYDSGRTYEVKGLDGKALRRKLVENNLRQLQGLGPVDVYFFEGLKVYLDYVRKHAEMPPNISFHSVYYDAYMSGVSRKGNPIIARDSKEQLWRLS
eukprot:TRINITY_DN54802_c0_g1_i1.p1 TRINITY_DN54802_c0_g1~~TRINITY_DN54802_c0_g1_i1.p1  ORF type:complete len:327 (+),score=37.13 TRINITY_DN54802_c0_g1_i1:64-1044(+)